MLQVAAVLVDMFHVAGDALEFLSFMIGPELDRYGMHQAKTRAISERKSPTNVKQLQAAVGWAVCNYYRCYLPDFSVIATSTP